MSSNFFSLFANTTLAFREHCRGSTAFSYLIKTDSVSSAMYSVFLTFVNSTRLKVISRCEPTVLSCGDTVSISNHTLKASVLAASEQVLKVGSTLNITCNFSGIVQRATWDACQDILHCDVPFGLSGFHSISVHIGNNSLDNICAIRVVDSPVPQSVTPSAVSAADGGALQRCAAPPGADSMPNPLAWVHVPCNQDILGPRKCRTKVIHSGAGELQSGGRICAIKKREL